MVISIHAARVGCDNVCAFFVVHLTAFQSTQPEWAATRIRKNWHTGRCNFNPRSPSGLRQVVKWKLMDARLYFNPRSPSGLRRRHNFRIVLFRLFQSTQPEWAATQQSIADGIADVISIHAARVGCDTGRQRLNTEWGYFNPRSPSGLRLIARISTFCGLLKFQSTQPEWAATVFPLLQPAVKENFNPRSPSGLRQKWIWCLALWRIFQSTQPEWAATKIGVPWFVFVAISIHAARVGCDSTRSDFSSIKPYFNPRSPSGLRPAAA